MADTFPRDRLDSNERHADDIHVHHREKKKGTLGPLIGLAALALGSLGIWAYTRSHSPAASCEQTTIRFERYGAAISPESRAGLAKLARCLRTSPAQTVDLIGRADVEELTYNALLPRARAATLAAELVALGVKEPQVAVTSNQTPCAEADAMCRTAVATPRPPPSQK